MKPRTTDFVCSASISKELFVESEAFTCKISFMVSNSWCLKRNGKICICIINSAGRLGKTLFLNSHVSERKLMIKDFFCCENVFPSLKMRLQKPLHIEAKSSLPGWLYFFAFPLPCSVFASVADNVAKQGGGQ